jgi:hypothetical protein
LHFLRVDAAGDLELFRRNAGMVAHRFVRQRFEIFERPFARQAPGDVETAAAQFENDFLARLIFEGEQRLFDAELRRLELIGRKVRPADDVGVKPQRGGEVVGERGTSKREVRGADRFVALNAKIIEGRRELFAVEFASARLMSSQRTEAEPFCPGGS